MHIANIRVYLTALFLMVSISAWPYVMAPADVEQHMLMHPELAGTPAPGSFVGIASTHQLTPAQDQALKDSWKSRTETESAARFHDVLVWIQLLALCLVILFFLYHIALRGLCYIVNKTGYSKTLLQNH